MNKPDNKYRRSDGTPISALSQRDELKTPHLGETFPGTFPFTRGIQPTMYRGRLWTMRQYAGFGSAQQSNQRYHQLLRGGQTGLSMAFDLPTQMGFDPDDAMSRGEVGKVGVSISTIDDMRTLLKDIPLADVSTSMTINATAAILLCFYIAVAEEQGVSKAQLRGTLQNDLLKEYIARGTYIFPIVPSLRLLTDIISYCNDEVPQFNPISISGYHIREAGSDAAQEVGFTLANAISYTQAAITRGLEVDAFAGRLSFFFASHNDFVEEIAKFRAARSLWAHIMRDRFKAKHPKSQSLRFHAQTGGSTLTAQQIDNNVVRTTLQAMAAILGGCQSLHTNGKDEALSLPTEQSAMLALRTQQILAEESGIAQTIDPCAGSYAIEKETQRIYREAEKIIAHVDALGGSAAAVEKGYFQNAIAERAYQFQRDVDQGARRIVGVNCYRDENAPDSIPRAQSNLDLEAQQIKTVTAFKAKRNAQAAQRAIQQLQTLASKPQENLVPAILNAVKQGATLGEISHALRQVFGTYQAP